MENPPRDLKRRRETRGNIVLSRYRHTKLMLEKDAKPTIAIKAGITSHFFCLKRKKIKNKFKRKSYTGKIVASILVTTVRRYLTGFKFCGPQPQPWVDAFR